MSDRTVGLIWAQASNGVIGVDGALPWHLPEDLALFRDLTMGSTVLMGRATWESLPDAVRPLPGRHNVVLSSRAGWDAPGAVVAGSLAAALEGTTGPVWVIGGASVYQQALPLADLVVVTELAESFPGDTFAPSLEHGWRVAARDPAHGWAESRTGLHFRVVRYRPEGDLVRSHQFGRSP